MMDEITKLRFHLQNVLLSAADLHVSKLDGIKYFSVSGTIDITARKRDVIDFQEAVANAHRDFHDIRDWQF